MSYVSYDTNISIAGNIIPASYREPWAYAAPTTTTLLHPCILATWVFIHATH